MIHKCRNFHIKELVPKEIYYSYGEGAWQFLSPLALFSLDSIREYFNRPVFVNTWSLGGTLQNRGLRPPWSDVGASMSQHRFGRAFDLDVEGHPAEAVRRAILDKEDSPQFQHINCLEDMVKWVHFDCRNLYKDDQRILIVQP